MEGHCFEAWRFLSLLMFRPKWSHRKEPTPFAGTKDSCSLWLSFSGNGSVVRVGNLDFTGGILWGTPNFDLAFLVHASRYTSISPACKRPEDIAVAVVDTLELRQTDHEATLLATTIIYYALGVFVGGIFVALSFHVRQTCSIVTRGSHPMAAPPSLVAESTQGASDGPSDLGIGSDRQTYV